MVNICIYNGMLIHGVSPSELQVGTMVPLQKDERKAHHSSDNYRALIVVNFEIESDSCSDSLT